jgi:uracil-DNA glycosylase family 4
MVESPNQILSAIIDTLCHYRRAGLDGYDCNARCLAMMETWTAPLQSGRRDGLEAVRAALGDCRRCPLSAARTQIVFGRGDPQARLVFVGEGPGRDEDLRGEPFVGAAGELLTRIIAAIRLQRDQVFICNVVKCRPPGNRTPQADEIATCRPFLARQIECIRPDFIVALGTVAAQTLLETDQPISRLRGRFHDYRGIRLLPTYHPAYLLRNPAKKRDVWEDMKLLMEVYPYVD